LELVAIEWQHDVVGRIPWTGSFERLAKLVLRLLAPDRGRRWRLDCARCNLLVREYNLKTTFNTSVSVTFTGHGRLWNTAVALSVLAKEQK